ncbi:MAG TPA: MarR family transcriptional regulator [Thermoleophilaceae bacterium]|nr:MarR family transcriptional regulator [Thermoleophilaceae bacterium]
MTTQLDLTDALQEFFVAARRARGRAASKPDAEGLSLAQYHLLEPLGAGPRTNRELAEQAGISAPTATRMIDGLLQRELVSRLEDPIDRRAVVISLTESGRAALGRKSRATRKVRERIAAAIEPHEQEFATELLRRLAAVMEEL